MIAPKCDKCKNELNEFGGILLSPPDENSKVYKFHLCKDCWSVVSQWIKISKASTLKIINIS